MTDVPRALCSVCHNRHRQPGGARCERCATGRTPVPPIRRTTTNIPTPQETS